ncbi:DUF5047 domain-containing protein [Micromonospora arida]
MRPVSDAFLRTLRGGHRMVAEARVVAPGLTGVNPTGTTIPILSGDVDMDGTRDIRSTLQMETEGVGMWPTAASDPLAPYGNEVFVRRGIQYGNGTTEWVSLGYFRINSPEQDDAPRGPIRISAQDRMAGIVEARLLAPKPYAATATFGSVVTALITEVYPWATIEWDDTTNAQQIGRAVIAEEERYQFLNELVTSVGKIWYWDHRGILVIKDPPPPASPVWDVNHGAGGVLVSMGRRLTREGVYNAVVATGEAADTVAPVRVAVVDNNPSSPTYWYGGFGKVPRFFSSPFITTAAQARSAAQSLLTRQLGLPYSADFSAVPNPALEPYDAVRIDYSATHSSEIHVIEALTVPLDAEGVLSASTREKTTVLIESV